MQNLRVSLAGMLFSVLVSMSAFAQNTGGVFGPAVNEGHASMQYRLGYTPETDGLAHRLHYQRAIDDDFMWRVVGQVRKTPDSDVDFDYVQAELFWDLNKEARDWRTGLRFDGRIRDDNRPGFVGVNWMNQFALTPRLQARAVVLSSVEIGDNARDGVFLQTRGNVNYSLEGRRAVGVEMFSAYGSTDDLRDFDEQTHQIGPFYSTPITPKFDLFASGLLGVTDNTPSTDLRLWATRRF